MSPVETTALPMDHAHIAEHAVIERYHRGDLSVDEEERFELHFMVCSDCQEQLALARGLQRSLRSIVAVEAFREVAAAGVIGWLRRRSGAMQAALITAALLIAAAPWAWLVLEGGRRGAGAGSLEAGVSNPPLVLLTVTRDGSASVLELGESANANVLLAVDAGPRADHASYRVRLEDSAGRLVLERSGLTMSVLEVVVLSVPQRELPPGSFRLYLEGQIAGGYDHLATYDLAVAIR